MWFVANPMDVVANRIDVVANPVDVVVVIILTCRLALHAPFVS